MSIIPQNKVTSFLVFPFLIVWLSILTIQSCKHEKQETMFSPDSPSSLYVHENFLGSESCKSCHLNEYNDWYTSHHAKAMAVANDSTVLADFNNVKFKSKGITSTFFRKGEKFFVNTIGGDGALADFEVVYTFGYTPLQQYLVQFPDGRLQALHLSWDTQKKEWFEQYPNDTFPPWDWLHWTKGAMTWNSMCADCHSTNVEKNFSSNQDSYETTWSIMDVSCEACHGPGRQHVEYINSDIYDSTNLVKGSFLKLTADISPIEQVEKCAPCHSRRSFISEKYDMSGRFLDHFVPEILRQPFYYADGQIRDEVYVYGSFIQSKMFQNGVSCSNCHNVHSGNLLLSGNTLCTQCHIKNKYDSPTHHFHPENTESANCISCHMQGEFYMVNDYRRDHSFRVPRPDLSVNYNVPNACNQCHTDKTASWSAEAIVNWYGPERKANYTDQLLRGLEDPKALIQLSNDPVQPPITRATAIDRMRNYSGEEIYQATVKGLSDRDARVRIVSVNSLANYPEKDRIRLLSPLLNDPIRSVRIAAAGVLADVEKNTLQIDYQGSFEIATKEYLISLKNNEDFSSGQFQIGQYQEMRGKGSLAAIAYRKSLQIDSLNGAPRINLSRVYNRMGRNDMAVKTLRDFIKLEPDPVDGYYYLGLIQAEENHPEEAISSFEKAIELQPLNPRYYYNLGLLLHKNGMIEQSEKVFLRGLELVPEADDVRYALATAYFENGKKELALKQAMILFEKYPQNQSLQQLVNTIRQSLTNQ